MQFDALLVRYFGTDDFAAIPPSALEVGTERMRVDLGLTEDRAHRFALWSLLFMLGEAPDLDAAFEEAEDREAARNFMDLASGVPE